MKRKNATPSNRGPLRVLFVITSMPVGGAESLLVNLIRRLDRKRFLPELCCLKQLGPLGESLRNEIPTHHGLLQSKFDLRVLGRLTRLMQTRQIDAVITVGAGDKMFWGRLAAWRAGVRVIGSALHSTGWPDSVGRLNRTLTRITDVFIGVARAHGQHLVENERFPKEKVFVIPNGVDTQRFHANVAHRRDMRQALGIPPSAPVCGIVAALRPEKNHALFLQAADHVRRQVKDAHFVVVGDGPLRPILEQRTDQLELTRQVHFLGTRNDIPQLLQAFDAFALTSDNEASPVSIMEAMATQLPVVATRVGSVPEMVEQGVTGYLTAPGDVDSIASAIGSLLGDPENAAEMGRAGRVKVVARGSIQSMVEGYQDLIEAVYFNKLQLQYPCSPHDSGTGPLACEEQPPEPHLTTAS